MQDNNKYKKGVGFESGWIEDPQLNFHEACN